METLHALAEHDIDARTSPRRTHDCENVSPFDGARNILQNELLLVLTVAHHKVYIVEAENRTFHATVLCTLKALGATGGGARSSSLSNGGILFSHDAMSVIRQLLFIETWETPLVSFTVCKICVVLRTSWYLELEPWNVFSSERQNNYFEKARVYLLDTLATTVPGRELIIPGTT